MSEATSWFIRLVSVLAIVIAAAQPGAADSPKSVVNGNLLRTALQAQGYVCLDLHQTKAGYLVTTAEVGDGTFRLMIDTGAPCTFLDPQRTKTAELEWKPVNDGGAVEPEHAKESCFVESIRIGPVSTRRMRVWSNDMADVNSGLSKRGESSVDGYIGNDLLLSHGAVIDYLHLKLFLRPTAGSLAPKSATESDDPIRKRLQLQGFVCVRLDSLDGAYLAKTVQVNHVDLYLVVDTGSPDTYFDVARTKARGLSWEPLTYNEAGRSVSSEFCRVETIQVRASTTFTMKNCRWAFPRDCAAVNESLGERSLLPVEGILGANLLTPHAAVIDVPNRRLFLLPTTSD